MQENNKQNMKRETKKWVIKNNEYFKFYSNYFTTVENIFMLNKVWLISQVVYFFLWLTNKGIIYWTPTSRTGLHKVNFP